MHTVSRGPEGQTTEWGDIQRKMGNFAPLAPVFKPDPFTPAEGKGTRAAAARGAGQGHLSERSSKELEELQDEFADDAFLEEYRRERLQELKDAAAVPRFGSVIPIARDIFMLQVTVRPGSFARHVTGCQLNSRNQGSKHGE